MLSQALLQCFSILSAVETFTRETQCPLVATRRSVTDWLWNHHVDNALVPCQQLNRRALIQHKMWDNRFPWLESALRSLTVVHCVVLSSCFSPSQKQSNTPINDANFNTWTQKITGLVVGLKSTHTSHIERGRPILPRDLTYQRNERQVLMYKINESLQNAREIKYIKPSF